MRKFFKCFLLGLIFLFTISLNKCVKANSINSISMDIYIDKNGDANITETWNCYSDSGTEVYHPYYNLGNSQIINLSVKEGSDYYSTISNWDTSADFSDKAYKCGINYIDNGVELCWGISDYGSHTYTVNYTITNFVSTLSDAQMVYWTLIPHDFSNRIDKTYIKIYADFDIPDTVDVWGYGNYGGTAYVYDGYIEMQSDGPLEKYEYMTILVKFPLGSFDSTNIIDNDFEYYYDMSKEGSTAYDSSSNNYSTNFFKDVFLPIFLICFFVIIFIIIGLLIYGETTRYNFKLSKEEKKEAPYYRNIPCDEDIFRAYYVANRFKLFRNRTDILGAFILRWIKSGLVKMEKRIVGTIIKKEDYVIIFNTSGHTFSNKHEKKIFNIMYKASKDGILERKEFKNWCSNNYSTIFNVFDDITSDEEKRCINERLISIDTVKSFNLLSRKEYNASDKLKEQAIQLAGFKRYLNDYTLISDREAIEVHLFEEYLIYAQMLGIAQKVAKQFKDLYPEIIEHSSFNSYNDFLFIYSYVNSGITAANTARMRAESYSSGGGGFSSGGGGGGSFGGGGGGGGFR